MFHLPPAEILGNYWSDHQHAIVGALNKLDLDVSAVIAQSHMNFAELFAGMIVSMLQNWVEGHAPSVRGNFLVLVFGKSTRNACDIIRMINLFGNKTVAGFGGSATFLNPHISGGYSEMTYILGDVSFAVVAGAELRGMRGMSPDFTFVQDVQFVQKEIMSDVLVPLIVHGSKILFAEEICSRSTANHACYIDEGRFTRFPSGSTKTNGWLMMNHDLDYGWKVCTFEKLCEAWAQDQPELSFENLCRQYKEHELLKPQAEDEDAEPQRQ